MDVLSRRNFLKVVGLAGTAAATGCSSESARHLISYVNAPEDIVPGEATWYATTCRECPAGCGMIAKNRDGRVIKVEGNPLHPVNRGKLCARGQASLHGLYNPDRFHGPLKRDGKGLLQSISWEEGEGLLAGKLTELKGAEESGRVVFMTELITGSLKSLIHQWVSEMGSGSHLIYEALAYESLRAANRIVFGEEKIPSYRIEGADFLVSFGAGFLETWLSNVEYAREFAAFRDPAKGRAGYFVYVGPRKSLTAANADSCLLVRPGDEYLVALGMLRVILEENRGRAIEQAWLKSVEKAVASFPLAEVAARTGIEKETIRKLARQFVQAERPLAMAEGLSCTSPHATETAVATNLLCALHPKSRELIDFDHPSALSDAVKASEVKMLIEKMREGKIEVLLLYNVNPLFTLPAAWELGEAFKKVPLVVSFSSWPDETTEFAHLILPAHTPLESWGDYSPREGITGHLQPVMENLFPSKHPGDILIEVAKRANAGPAFPWVDFREFLLQTWKARLEKGQPGLAFEPAWLKMLQRGGTWSLAGSEPSARSLNPSFRFDFPRVPPSGNRGPSPTSLVTYPTIQFYDGREANRPWIQELPDPITQVVWGGWVEIHPDTARELGLTMGDLVLISTAHGALEVPVLPIDTVPPDTMAIPFGQGHKAFGRYASDLPANPLSLFPPDVEPLSGGVQSLSGPVKVARKEGKFLIAHTDGSRDQQGRELIQEISLEKYKRSKRAGEKPALDLPLPQGYDPAKDFYPPHPPKAYRWCMIVDLDRCIGCGACVVACYAENNLAVVGREQILRQREMSWIRVERYFSGEDSSKLGFLPMLCQHCENAPCESVCPVSAPSHNPEGLNIQVYNRCIGTRDCSQNDPYKVRRFNFFTYTHPFPLDLQLNPDVTVRQKGVMEKCSFCIQRIVAAKIKARDEGRKVKDGDFTTACAQTCPTNALIFGSLLDPASRVSQLIRDPRAYQVLRDLNTKPAAIYLKRVTREL